MQEKTVVNGWVRKYAIRLIALCLIANGFGLATAQDLIQPAPDMPLYTLGTVIHATNARGRPTISIEFQRTKEGVGKPALFARTSERMFTLKGPEYFSEASGKLELGEWFSRGSSPDAEVFVALVGTFADACPYQCLASNVVRIGNYSASPTMARDWNETESAAYQKELLGRKPPLSPPPGHQLVRGSTKIVPGMQVKVGRYGEWVDAEALTNHPQVTVKIDGVSGLRLAARNGWLAIKPSVLQQADASPNSFRPSLIAIPGTTEKLPDDYVMITETMKIVAGTPVQAIWQDRLTDATVLSVDGNQLSIHYDSRSTEFDKVMDRHTVVIAESTLDELAKPNAEELFAARLPKAMPEVDGALNDPTPVAPGLKRTPERIQSDASDVPRPSESTAVTNAGAQSTPSQPMTVQNNPIEIPMPREAAAVPLDFLIPRGTKLAACWGNKWNFLTVLKDSREDTILIHWDDRSPEFDGLMHRSQLIIRKSDLKKLRIKAARSEKRTWTDSSGKHTLEAIMSSRTATHVTLLREDGKEVTLPIEKLSAVDQKWLLENP